MGFGFGDLLDPFDLIDTGGSIAPGNILDPGKDERQAAVRAQTDSGFAAIEEARAAREAAAERLDPFASVGRSALMGDPGAGIAPIISLLDSEQAAQNLINNPLFQAIGGDVQRRLFANQAAQGKLGSGGTQDLLMRNLLQLGPQLIDRDFSRRFDLGRLGANAAAGQATGAISSGQQIGGLLTDIGSAASAGQMADAQAQNALFGNLTGAGIGAGLGALGALPGSIGAGAGALLGFLSDERAKDNIEYQYTDVDGIKVYNFNYIGRPEVKYLGKMAQEIMREDPGSVLMTDQGYYIVAAKYRPVEVKYGATA